MKFKKIMAVTLVMALTASMTACGGSNSGSKGNTGSDAAEGASNSGADIDVSYADIKLGEDYKDLKASIKVFNQRTDLSQSDYKGAKNWDDYIADFNKEYPDIQVSVETDTNYADDALLRLQGGDWGDIMMIPAVDKKDLSEYFMPLGDLETMKGQINYATQWMYDNQVYGVPSTATAKGIVYNKKVFKEAGVDEKNLPKTPQDFLKVLQKIADNNKGKGDDEKVIPLYTNYADQWPMGEWDAYITGTGTGDSDYSNQKLLHTKNPFQNYNDDTHAYAVYKILYDAVQNKLTEDDYTTTSWDDSKGMLNNGKIGCMMLGSWAYSQMQAAGPNADDIGYMSFPITVDGKQYATTGADYSYGINKDSSKENREASLVFIKWMTEKSGYSFNEGGLPIKAGDENYPEVYKAFEENDVNYVEDNPAKEGEESLLSTLNADSELNINNGGNTKVQSIVEHATNNDESFDDIMEEWNQAWSDAQESNDVETE
ncbi:MAG: ABC transporter substrate-binding protein [Lachnospiraceae bacterium]